MTTAMERSSFETDPDRKIDIVVAETIARCRDLSERGEIDSALQALESISGDGADAWLVEAEHARVLSAGGRYSEALASCNSALEERPNSLDVRFTRAVALLLMERLDDAIAELNGIVRDAPTFPNAAWIRAGAVRRVLGDLDPETLAAFDIVLNLDSENRYARVERADVLRSLGRYKDAMDIYAAIDADDTDDLLRAEAAFKLGCVAFAINDAERARAAIVRTLELAPGYPDAREMIAMIDGAPPSTYEYSTLK